MLEVRALEAAYGQSRILFGVDLDVREAEFVTLMGRNGMGKTTTLRSIFGLLKPTGGRVAIGGRDVTGSAPHVIARLGLGLVPEGRQIFPTLSVEENLLATARTRPGAARWTLPSVYDLFPRLAERRSQMGDKLSGGEQQMLAIGRALMTNPRLLVLDEATEGLAPLIRAEIWACLGSLKREGVAILVVDRHVEALSAFADRHVVIEKGQVAWAGTSAQFAATPAIRDRFLSV